VRYRVDVASRRVEKELEAVDNQYRERVIAAIKELGENPKPHGCKKLEGIYHRIRVGPYRVIYAVLDDEYTVVVHRVRRRAEDTYRNL
jgi:mRNA interferase RelE/StbE